MPPMVSKRYTFRENLASTRHGWIRLTPAYSKALVEEILEGVTGPVFDPFGGTGTTALVCAERGIPAVSSDINGFLDWLGRTKTRVYSRDDVAGFEDFSAEVDVTRGDQAGVPVIRGVEKWWPGPVLGALARLNRSIEAYQGSEAVQDMARVAFCRTLIGCSTASFGHQSMSFRADAPSFTAEDVASKWLESVDLVAKGASSEVKVRPRFLLSDARALAFEPVEAEVVITSPPYANRMSYIRELRPYMFWLGYLTDARQAGELDWEAIGGTWGGATSRLSTWCPNPEVPVPFDGFETLCTEIEGRSRPLAQYVRKYFEDVVLHVRAIRRHVKPGGRLHYVVGNSKFYETLVPTEAIYAAILAAEGFGGVGVRVLRNRSSKRELTECVVTARA